LKKSLNFKLGVRYENLSYYYLCQAQFKQMSFQIKIEKTLSCIKNLLHLMLGVCHDTFVGKALGNLRMQPSNIKCILIKNQIHLIFPFSVTFSGETIFVINFLLNLLSKS
jgi:hypothetical protein